MQDLYERSGVRVRESWGMVWSEARKVGNQGQEGGVVCVPSARWRGRR